MSTSILSRLYHSTIDYFEKITASKNWQFKLVTLALLTGLCASFPDYHYQLTGEKNSDSWQFVKQQIASPLTTPPVFNSLDPASNEAKRAFRLFMPVLGHILHLDRFEILVLQNLMGILFLWILLRLTYRLTEDKISTLFIVLGTSLTFPSLWFFNTFSTNLDGPGYLLLLSALYFPSSYAIFSLAFLASFVDERVFACFGFVVIWWKLTPINSGEWNWRRMLALDRPLIAVLLAFLTHGSIRYYLINSRGFHLPVGDSAGVGFENIRANWKVFSPTILSPFEGQTLLIVAAAVVMFAQKKWSILISFTIVSCAVILQSFAVGDCTRSLAYGFPVILLSIKILQAIDPKVDFRKFSALTLVLCFLIPSFNVTQGVISWFTPFFPKVLKLFL